MNVIAAKQQLAELIKNAKTQADLEELEQLMVRLNVQNRNEDKTERFSEKIINKKKYKRTNL